MKTATITEAKNGLSALIDRVLAGESVTITDRGRAVAILEPIGSAPDPSGRLERLQRAGLIRLSKSAPPLELIRTPPPRPSPGESAVDLLLEERRTGR
jgi:prevent-host-death family protein